jgi:hypothetical protein
MIARRSAWCLAGILPVLPGPGIASASRITVATDTNDQTEPEMSRHRGRYRDREKNRNAFSCTVAGQFTKFPFLRLFLENA